MTEMAMSGYPVALTATRPPSSSRFWAIPLIGFIVKEIILIPHLIVLYVLGLVVGVCQLVIWIPVLFGGQYPDWAYGLNAGYIRWFTRIGLFFLGLNDSYPAFAMEAPGDVYIAQPQSPSRFFAIPIIGAVVRWILLIPHFIVVYVLFIVVYVLQLIIWIWVLFGGQYPDWAFGLVAGTILWLGRIYAYVFGLTDKYPPF